MNKKECEYCNNEMFSECKSIDDESYITVLVLPTGQLHMTYGGIHEIISIKYCPMCGRKLKSNDGDVKLKCQKKN